MTPHQKLIDDKLYPSTNDKAVPATMEDFGGKATLNEEAQSKVYAISEEVAEAKVAKLKEELTGKIEKSVTGTYEVNKNYYESVWNTLTKTIDLLHQKIEEYDKNNKKLNDVQKLVEGLGEGLGVVKTKLAIHGHDGLKVVPEMVAKVANLQPALEKMQSQIDYLGRVARRLPTGDVEKLELTDKTEHYYRKYKSDLGLTKPHHRDELLGDGYWVDLSEPDK